jgi:predicted Fe-Mo cluster-binding NifX family protein
MDVPWLGAVPIDPRIVETGDEGAAFLSRFADSEAARALQAVIAPLAALLEGKPDGAAAPREKKEENGMRIAIPLMDGKLCQHFGHCASFALVDTDPASGKVLKREDIEAPPHEPGKLPGWLAERGAGVIIAGGMGGRAQELFSAQGIKVVVGAPAGTPERLVADYLAGTLVSGANACDH